MGDDKKNNCVSLFFGAGAEACFGMINGSDFIIKSLFFRNNKMTTGLNNVGAYDKYREDFLFKKNSNVFKDMIFRTLKTIYLLDDNKNKKDINNLVAYYNQKRKIIEENVKDIKEEYVKELLIRILKNDRIEDISKNKMEKDGEKTDKEKFDKLVEEIYSDIVTDNSENSNKDKQHVDNVTDNSKIQNEFINELKNSDLEFAGCLERDFATLMGLNKNDNFRYSRLFNYYWSSFFSIIDKIIEKDDELIKKYELDKDKQDYYFNVFSNLKAIITEIYDEKFLKNYENNKKNDNNDNNENKNYYEIFSSKDFDNWKLHSVITTNYTPFMELYFDRKENNNGKCDNKQDEPKKSIYLSGKLSLFERSNENEVFDIRDEKKLKPIDYFPFIMTQSPIKPIIHPKQIIEYNNFLKALESSEILIIIGYSLTKNDNHICCFLKEYYLKGNTIIYCKYEEDVVNDEKMYCDEAKEECLKNLNLDKYEDKNRFHVIINTGNADDLFENVNLKIKEIFSKEEKQAA